MADRFYYCKHCHNLIGVIHASGVVPVCCGEPMTQLVANTVDASKEKHLPVVQIEEKECGRRVNVSVGSVAHPMTPEHLIEWIYVETCCGGHRISLSPESAPEAVVVLPTKEKPLAVYAYCNLHGLWKTEL